MDNEQLTTIYSNSVGHVTSHVGHVDNELHTTIYGNIVGHVTSHVGHMTIDTAVSV